MTEFTDNVYRDAFIKSVRRSRDDQIALIEAAHVSCSLLCPAGSVGYSVARKSARNLIDALKTCANLEILALRRAAIEAGS